MNTKSYDAAVQETIMSKIIEVYKVHIVSLIGTDSVDVERTATTLKIHQERIWGGNYVVKVYLHSFKRWCYFIIVLTNISGTLRPYRKLPPPVIGE
ncbi:MAG: hypothetical protein H6779_05350 [Candidatus Nomurabacteria bacterium]|nr:MAG: hypothetical protein H6779_05350 [Candidatus Nomurabacteria bacterium]